MKTKLKDNRIVKSYSEAFKQTVLQSIASGRYTKSEARQVYGISTGIIYYWIKQSNRLSLHNKRIRVETADEQDQLKSLQQRIRDLEKALADSQLQNYKSKSYLAVAAERLGYKSWEDFEKKNGQPPSTGG